MTFDNSIPIASHTFDPVKDIELKLQTDDMTLDQQIYKLKVKRISTRSTVTQSADTECLVEVQLRDVCWDLPIIVANPTVQWYAASLYVQYQGQTITPMTTSWTQYGHDCGGFSYTFSYVSGDHPGMPDLSMISVLGNTASDFSFHDLNWVGTHTLRITGYVKNALTNTAISDWSMTVSDPCETATFPVPMEPISIVTTVRSEAIVYTYTWLNDNVSAAFGGGLAYYCDRRVHFLESTTGGVIYPYPVTEEPS